MTLQRIHTINSIRDLVVETLELSIPLSVWYGGFSGLS